MAGKKGLGIKSKTRLGCVILGLILLFSSVISIYEFRTMNKYVTDIITDDIKCMDSARQLLEVAQKHNISLMEGLENDSFEADTLIEGSFKDLKEIFVTERQKTAVDSVMYAYVAYMQVASEAEELWTFDKFIRRDWFFNRLQPVFITFRGYLNDLSIECENALVQDSQNLQHNYHRSIMPAVISLILSLLLVMLFNYYLNYYLINPLLKVNRNIKSYRQFGKKYDVKLDSTDEIAELNENVKDLIDLNQSYKKHIQKQ